MIDHLIGKTSEYRLWIRQTSAQLGAVSRLEGRVAYGEQNNFDYLAVARAIANRPSVILADEPTAALDSHRGRQVMELFAQVAHEPNAGVVVVTHDQRALDVFYRTYEMEDGRMFESSPSAHVAAKH